MIRPILCAIALTACAPITPATAYTILPNLYASKFCELRAAGVDYEGAMQVATRSASVDDDNWVMVTAWGKSRRSDIVESVLAVEKLCPRLMK